MSVIATVVSVTVSVVLLAATAILAAADAAVMLIDVGRVRRIGVSGRRGGTDLQRLMERPGRLLATHAFVSSLTFATTGALLTWALTATYGMAMYIGVVVGLSGATFGIFVFGQALPRTFAMQSPERVALALVGPARALTAVLYPLPRALSILWTWGMSLVGERRWPGAPWVTFQEYDHLTAKDADETSEEAREALIQSVQDFTGRIVREVMVPRTDMVCIEDSATATEALEVIGEAGFSRVPVYHENLDDIRGILYARDLLLAMGEAWEPKMRISRLVRPAFFVPETKPVHELLVQMRRTAHMAMVADEYGGTAGLVTIEDLLEEIVGEIFDEYDMVVPTVVELGDGRVRVDARMPVSEMNELFGTEIVREADSVGGLFIEEAGRIPEAGESVVVDGLRLIVDELEGNRILHLIVEKTPTKMILEGQDDGDNAV